MADPFSIAVSAISLAAVFKEVVELAQRLDDSFQQVSRNKEQASRLSLSILERLKNLQRFSDDHAGTLETAHELKLAILELRREMELVCEKTKAFDAIPSKGRFGRIKPIFRAWLKRDKVEANINQIDNHIKECYANFVMFTALRTNVHTHQILESTRSLEASKPAVDRILAAATRITIAQKASCLPDASQSNENSHYAHQMTTNPKITKKPQTLSFSKSAAAAEILFLSKASEHVIAEVYLRNRITSIDRVLARLARSQMFPMEEPIEYFTSPLYFVYAFNALSPDHPLHHDRAVNSALSITAVLQRHHMSLSVQKGVIDMFALSKELCMLGMSHEAVTISRWTVDLLRTMLNSGPVVYQPFLCMALENLAKHQEDVGDFIGASHAIAACLKLSREMQGIFHTYEIRSQLASALVCSSRLAQQDGDNAKALVNATEAISIYEKILREVSDWEGLDPFSPLSEQSHIAGRGDDRSVAPVVEIQTETSAEDAEGQNSDGEDEHSIFMDITNADAAVEETEASGGDDNNTLEGIHKYIYDYGLALRVLSKAQYALHQYQESSESGLQSLNIAKQIDLLYHSVFVRQDLAEAYYELTWTPLRDHIPTNNALIYANKAVDIYGHLSKLPKASHLNYAYYDAMEAYTRILRDVKRYDEALEVSQEMARVAGEMMDDQSRLADSLRDISRILHLLGREDEATSLKNQSVTTYRVSFKATSRNLDEGENSLQLAEHLYESGWYQDAVEVYQEAIVHYRILAMDGGVEGLAEALIGLASCFDDLKQYDRALNEGHEALRLLEDLVDDEPSILPLFIQTLDVNLDAAFHSDVESKSMERSQYCLRQYHRIFELYPEQIRDEMVWALDTHGFKLNKHDKTQEAIEWRKETIEWHEAQPVPRSPDLEYYRLVAYADCGDDFMKLGQMDKALRFTNQAIEIGTNQKPPDINHGSGVYYALWNRTQILLSLGRSAEALESSMETISYTDTNPKASLFFEFRRAIAYSLNTYAAARIGSHGPDLIVVVEKAVRVCRGRDVDLTEDDDSGELPAPICLSWCLRALADALADARRVESAVDYAREGYTIISNYKATKPRDIPWADIESEFLPTRLVFAVQLLATGDNESAASHLGELVSSVKESVKVRPGYYPIYANALRILGWCYCSLGRHEDGVRISAELRNLSTRLQLVCPHISELVEVELAADIKRPSRLALWKGIDLQCGHYCWEGEEAGE